MKNGSYQTIGYIQDDGTVKDGSYQTIGYIQDDGTVKDGSYQTIGYIQNDGTVKDEFYQTIGYADSNIDKEKIAFFYFFLDETNENSNSSFNHSNIIFPRSPIKNKDDDEDRENSATYL